MLIDRTLTFATNGSAAGKITHRPIDNKLITLIVTILTREESATSPEGVSLKRDKQSDRGESHQNQAIGR